MPRRLIRDVIAGRPLITAGRNDTVREACRLMAQKKIGALLIVDAGRIAGIFTERDALNKVLAAGLDPDKTRVSQVMVTDLQTIRAGKPLAYALHMMAEGGFRHVPVVDDDGGPVGMVSARDALGADLIDLEREIKRQEELESSIGY
ncbi:MAG TPA: CBS domain-containing protein [Rhodocyclaceae bacterium]|mgnify:CR=1 FL=1|jgi:CBS domain-containing protein|nr:CBS domain-containing protein [Rhodocyclaceae bacterium]HMW76638.1 CBS domain-containing protein [Rhodocyclaceae bacterium]HNE42841.1 CBS domain-containing protein [Rhodocyclaceae bacterium]HNL20464.1 CBS domain-containing protein [Rhodocyclaceae bacterium]HNM21767.1 CBS domain-containing protein [Rhodocyclaceae bacterium]